jgi:hypothetical protein
MVHRCSDAKVHLRRSIEDGYRHVWWILEVEALHALYRRRVAVVSLTHSKQFDLLAWWMSSAHGENAVACWPKCQLYGEMGMAMAMAMA